MPIDESCQMILAYDDYTWMMLYNIKMLWRFDTPSVSTFIFIYESKEIIFKKLCCAVIYSF